MLPKRIVLLLLFFTYFANAQEFITNWSKSSSTTEIEFEATTTELVAYTWETLPPAAAASGSIQIFFWLKPEMLMKSINPIINRSI